MSDGAGEGQGNSPRVLVAEDEIVVAIFIEDMLAEFGYRLAGVVSRLEEAMAHPANYDLAVLDVHLNGQPVFEFADQLAANGTPFVFATGYGERGIPRPPLRVHVEGDWLPGKSLRPLPKQKP